VHNFVPIIIRRLGNAIGIESLSRDLISQFIKFDLVVIALGLAMLLAFRKYRKNAKSIMESGLALLSGVISMWALFVLANLPADPKNAFLLGYSLSRFLPMLGLDGFAFVAFGAAFFGRQSSLQEHLRGWLEYSHRWLSTMLLIGLAGSLVLQMQLSMNVDAQDIVRIARIIPLLNWSLLQFSLIGLWILLQKPATIDSLLGLPGRFTRWLSANPTALFAISALSLVGIAQLLDKDWISVAPIFEKSNLWVSNWNLWIEEFFEAAGGILLAMGTFYFPKSSDQS
jgi:hypothetical protein